MKISRYGLSIALSVCFLSLGAQPPDPPPASVRPGQPLANTLLWRISGKNHQPSYLYGTMHLTDERVFNLGDSLYAAIKASEGFAMELDPNSLSSFVIEEVQKEIYNSKNIKELLSDKEYKTYGPLLEKKLKKPLNRITSDDILKEKNKWIGDTYRTGKMQTFLDVYLFDIARRQDKWTGGVEDLDDQRGIINDVVDKSDIRDLVAEDHSSAEGASLQRLIAVYMQQDLNSIDTLFGSNKDIILWKRNLKMSQRMDSLSAVRSMVFAVGAAHLPGEQGLISLLRKKGFTVEPVFSSRKIKASDYTVREMPVTWHEVKDDESYYQVSMPGIPGNVEVYGMLQMKMYFDLFNGTAYLSMAVRSAFAPSRNDSLLDATAKRMFNRPDKKDFVPIIINGAHGRIYTVRDHDGYKKGYLLIKDGVIYMAFGAAGKEMDRNRQDIDHFFHSFSVLDRKPLERDSLAMVPFVDTLLAYRIMTPTAAKPFSAGQQKETEWNTTLYVSSDPPDGTYCFFGSNSVKPGHYVPNDSTLFRLIKARTADKLSSISFDTTYVRDDQLVTEFRGRMKEADMLMTTRYIARGNRWYGLIAMYPLSGPTVKVKKFLSSFTELDYPSHTWQMSVSSDSTLSTWVPSPLVRKERDSTFDVSVNHKYTSFDSSRSQSYDVIVYHLGPYFWSNSDSMFWAQRIAAYLTYKDSLIDKKLVSNGEAKGWEWVKKEHGSHLYQRQRLLLNGDRLYDLVINAPLRDLYSPDANRFFEDFRFSGHPAATGYFVSKAQVLVKDLFSEDPALAARALEYMRSAPFGKSDLPLLQKALLKEAPLDRKGTGYRQVSNSIATIVGLLKDSSTFRFAADNYRKVPDSNAFIKNHLLELMVAFRDSAHFAEMLSLLHASPPTRPLSYTFLWRLRDSLKLTAGSLSDLLPLLKDSCMHPSMTFLFARLLDSNLLTVTQLLPYREDILRYAGSRAHLLSAYPDSTDLFDEELVEVTGRFNDDQGNRLVTAFGKAKSNDMKLTAIRVLLRNKQPLADNILLSLASNPATRLRLYSELEEAGQSGLFPPVFLTQKAFAESEVYKKAQEEEEDVTNIVFLSSQLFETSHGKKRFFFFKDGVGEYAWLACSGPYDPEPSHLNIKEAGAIINYKENFNAALLNQQMDRLLQRFN